MTKTNINYIVIYINLLKVINDWPNCNTVEREVRKNITDLGNAFHIKLSVYKILFYTQ